jgi:Family of unknown function (DUF6356)
MSGMNLKRAFTEHPASVGETYSEHLVEAVCFGTRMMLAGIACLVHGALPFLFVRTGSRAIANLNERMITNRRGVSHPLAGRPQLPL